MGLHSQVHLEDPKCTTSWRRDRRMGMYHNIRNEIDGTGAEVLHNSGLKTFLEQHCKNDPGVLLEPASVGYIATQIGLRIFQFMIKDTADVDISLTLKQVGIDSLMAIELRRCWRQDFELDVSVLEIIGASTVQGYSAANRSPET